MRSTQGVILSWYERYPTRMVLGALLGSAGGLVTVWAAPRGIASPFVVPVITTVLATLTVGGFWPAMVAALLVWGVTGLRVLAPGGISPADLLLLGMAAAISVAACALDARARRERQAREAHERRLAETEARNRELFGRVTEERDLLDAILATTEAAVSAFELPSRRLLFANQRFAELWGTTRERIARDGVLGLELEFATADGQPYPPGWRPADLVLERGDLVREHLVMIRTRGRTWRHYSLSGTPLRDADGRISGVVFSTVDATERAAAETALSASEDRLRRLTDAVPGCVYQFEQAPNGTRTFTFISGGMRDLLNTPAHDPVPTFEDLLVRVASGDRERLLRSLDDAAHSPARWTEEFLVELTDGTRKWIRGTAVPDPSPGDRGITWNGLLLDVTDRKRLEDDLLQVQKMESIGRLAGGVAHDFNNILTAIRGNVDLLLESIEESHPHVGELRDIQDAAQRATTLTRQLLAFSRKQALQVRAIDLGALVRDMEKMLRRVIGEDIVLLTQPSDDAGLVRADPGQVEQVLMNLAINARDAMPDGGLLTLETRAVLLEPGNATGLGLPPGEYVSLVVRDTGHGMDDQVKARIFDPFFTTKPAGKGTGLGLAMVYGIVRQSGGGITVDTAVGRGTTFRIYLPRAVAAGTGKVERITPPSVSATALPGGTVLLVEDDAAVRGLTQRMLKDAGLVVRAASDAYEALTLAGPACDAIDAVVTDVIMPGLGGRDLVRELRSRRPDLRVLYISGYLDIDVQRLGLDDRTRLLTKPFAREALLRQLAALLDPEPART
ncbi:MAG: response regulator [Gemmatimonadetes bacterium]|nr:response regulator [Gemmatimonadota bacterium]